ncbi:MAG: type 2 isopentenyl-diphosphate Delta-isomerase [Anaerolineae bacterium]|nr:type 2 isopentenyl-diphosphate Delta-isomerase [Anaerolineae bacterium]
MSKVTEQRKEEHITINLEQNVQFPNLTTGLENYHFLHRALPELNLNEIDTSVTVFGKKLKSPIFMSSMTGGTDRASKINRTLAQAAQQYGLAMGVGSQRAAIENPALGETFYVRDLAPDILLFANLGAIQLNYGYGVEHCRRAIDIIEADALILHFNVLQEAVQPEGDTQFRGLIDRVAEICAKLPIPVIAKEVGWGFSEVDAKLLAEAGVSAIDVAGAGGTSWSEVEYHRAPTAFHAQVARSFADWGIPTAEAIGYVKKAAPEMTIFASGGLRDGIDVAKCIALGARMAGMAGPFLKAAAQSVEAVGNFIEITQRQLEIAMLCSGTATLEQLAQIPLIKRS